MHCIEAVADACDTQKMRERERERERERKERERERMYRDKREKENKNGFLLNVRHPHAGLPFRRGKK